MAASTSFSFTEDEMAIDEDLGFPKAYAKLCQNPHFFDLCNRGPPSIFIPYKLQTPEALIARDLNHMFPIIDADRKPSPNPRNYTSLLWKQLIHLGDAGFDPTHFRVDPYGNVLYFHADLGSPLAWEIDHWFPCSRGGRTVPSNLRLLQRQVCRKKQNKLEFLIPWWDLQLGISVNQFLSIFASKNSDFRNRAFSWLFSDSENAELNATPVGEFHIFPHHFVEMSRKVGLAPAAIVSTRGELDASALKPVDLNRLPAPNSPAISARKFSIEDDALCKTIQRLRPNTLKENDNSDMGNNPYATIAMARDSLKHREATKCAEMQELEDELNEMKHKNEAERLQDLESVLLKRKRRVEKCRRLAEAQSSYRDLLEKMIRDSMHQTVVYKEQIKLNQTANSALMARLEAQRAICYSSEKELHRRFKQRDELENQIRPYWEQVRKRSRIDDTLSEERCDKTMQLLPGRGTRMPLRKELRQLLEEQKAFEARVSLAEEEKQEEEKQRDRHLIITDNVTAPDDKLLKLSIREEDWRKPRGEKKIRSVPQSPRKEDDDDGQCRKAIQKMKVRSVPQSPQNDDEEYRKRIGKVNLDKWLQMLLEDNQDGPLPDSSQNISAPATGTNEIVKKLN
ncbi:uncharacterized protein LOC131255560 [Magnolia sinica]|uniref:uncharacterized protein LOC131255560 n=1 Tax=Magnolia sinica TaxID=86752 RepID=UPI00265B403C|nr:uncharacterized protein LOC131255560 [Magnolia sinica]